MGSLLRLIGRHSRQDGQGTKKGRILRGAAAEVQGLLQADGHQQGWPAVQERPARSLRQRRCAHERVRAGRSAGRDLWTLGDKMTKAEIDDIFGEFEIDEDYMIKTKDVISLFVAVKEEPKAEEPPPVEEAPVEEE